MVPAAVVDKTIADLLPLLEAGDILIDGGNSYYVDDIRRAKELRAKGIHYVDVGTSGGVWGLERGYCMMIGGEPDDREASRSDLRARSRPASATSPRTPGREKTRRHGRAGLSALRAERRRPLREDGAQRHRVRTHGGVCRGPRHSARREHRQAHARRRCRDDAAARSRALSIRPQSRRHRRGLAARQRDCVVAARSDRDGAARRIRRSTKFTGRVSDSGEGRWTIQAAIDEAVPAPVLTTALYERFSSRGEADFQDKLLSAMRFEFGGHVEKPAG